MPYIYTFILLFGFWLLLSGRFDLFHISLGLISSLLVSLMSADLLFQWDRKGGRLAEAGRFFLYIPWILKEILLSSLHVAYLALHPDMKSLLNPGVIIFKTRLRKNISRAVLANSITLTPGTITIRVVDDVFYVHALTSMFAAGLPGEMEKRIAGVFEEED
ncbi:MAG: Na+/H+ antiporter subunit E [Desulfurivibrionaceae bacterium]